MAIAIEGFTIVVLKERIEESYDGGLPALALLVSNGTALADDDLWRGLLFRCVGIRPGSITGWQVARCGRDLISRSC